MYVSFSTGTLSRRFQLFLLVMVLGLFGAGTWFTYNTVHIANQNSARLVSKYSAASTAKVTTFQQCAAAGNPVVQTYPETCTTASGQQFVNH